MIFRKNDILLDIIGHSFETSGVNFFKQELTIRAKSYLEGIY